MLPESKVLVDPNKEKKMKAIPPLQLSSSKEIINIHDTKKFQDKHNKIPGANKYGLANLSDVEETKTSDIIKVKDGKLSIERGIENEEIPAFRPNSNFVSDKEALEDL